MSQRDYMQSLRLRQIAQAGQLYFIADSAWLDWYNRRLAATFNSLRKSHRRASGDCLNRVGNHFRPTRLR